MENPTLAKMRQFKAMLKNGKYTSLGCYPLFLITKDCAALCHDCAVSEKHLIYDAIRDNCDNGWLVVAQDINWEDSTLYCDHCNNRIESAYAEDMVEVQ